MVVWTLAVWARMGSRFLSWQHHVRLSCLRRMMVIGGPATNGVRIITEVNSACREVRRVERPLIAGRRQAGREVGISTKL